VVVEDPDEAGAGGGGIRRRYPEVEGVAPRLLEALCTQACRRFAARLADGVPPAVAGELGLSTLAEALRVVHLDGVEPDPESLQRLQRGEHEAQARLVFDELFSLQLAVSLRRAGWSRRHAPSCVLGADDLQRLRACLPFELTGGQRRVTEEILADMARDRPMHRLLQGDVGSGKTVVAFSAAWAAMASGRQAAIMAPTELLARQHFSLMEPWCRALGRRAALLTAATPRGARESLLALSDAAEVHLLVGTHALLSPRVSMPDLGLVIVDEQHRFGVVQRTRLRDREPARPLPHLLVMTATPIPRTLALAVYGDLDLSILDEKPPGRRPAHTQLFVGKERKRAYELVADQLGAAQQVFVVCPLVEESEKLQAADATSTAEELQRRFADYRVGLVHGRLSSGDRARVMDRFRRRELDLLVATTVIEVGIDVPEANVMVIEHAERFGLAQLHQLRGRVGRGSAASVCVLLYAPPLGETGKARLKAMLDTHDGFEIARRDLEIRGPGEFMGARQSGDALLRFADLAEDNALLQQARRIAPLLLRQHPEAAQRHVQRWLGAGAEFLKA
jgi:ATP-dependent DNA helicase RecG